jgi:hypothetical protein
MATNSIPRVYDPLVQLFSDAVGGAAEHGTSIGLKQNDHAALTLSLERLIGKPAGPGGNPPAVLGLKADWNLAKAAKVTIGGLFRSAKSNGRTLAKACVNVLKPRLGDAWNNDWQNAGFTTGSLAIPENPLTLLQQLRAYFSLNTTHERLDIAPGLHATAAACEAAADAIAAASNASNESNVGAGTAKAALDDGIAAARSRLSGLREELSHLIPGDDARWYSFGFERPDDPETPETAENLTLASSTGGSLFADWDDARRAESYRASVFNAATNAKLAELLVQDSDANFSGLPTDIPLRVEVTSINAAGESPAVVLGITLAA